MTPTTLPLHDLAERISQQQAELAKLHQEYETRQVQLKELFRRKEQLQAQLQQVEAEIQVIGPGGGPPEAKPPAGSSAATPAPAKPEARAKGGVTLGQVIMQIVTQAGRPMTVKELTDEVVRRKHPTTSRNLPALVADRVKDLVKRRLLRRAPNRKGVLPVSSPAAGKVPAARSASGTPGPRPKTPMAPGSATAPAAASMSAWTLQDLITKILTESAEPLTASKLAEKVLASGYRTTSKDFKKVVSVAIWKMGNVENVPGKGYRLKKGKTTAASKRA